MGEGLKHGKMCRLLKTEEERRPSPRRAVLANQWDSVESDTESLAQERAYQLQLQMRIGQRDQIKFLLSQRENVDSLQQGDRGDDDVVNEDNTEEHQVFDSLEVAVHPQAKNNPILLPTEIQGTSQLLSDDAYSDIRYDPNWRTNLKGAGRFNESPQISFEEHYQDPGEISSQSCDDGEGLVLRGGYRYVADTSPAPVVSPHGAANECNRSYRLHPQNDQTSSVTSPQCHSRASQLRSTEADSSGPFSISTKSESHSTLQRGFREKADNSFDNVSKNIGRPPELTENIQAMHIEDFQTFYQQEPGHTGVGLLQTQQRRSSSPPTCPKILSNQGLGDVMGDIVERNKITLGRNTAKCGSYVKVHALKQEMPHHVKKVHVPLKETTSTGSQEDRSAPSLRLLDKTQRLKVTEISKGKKAQRREYPNPSRQQLPPAPGVKAEHGDCLTSPLAKPASMTQPKSQMMTSSEPSPPTVHLNIHLNTPSHLLPLLEQMGQDAIINLASLHDHTPRSSASEVALLPGYRQTNPVKPTHRLQEWINAQLLHQNLESIPEQWQRTTASKWPSSCERQDQRCSPNEAHAKQFTQTIDRTPTSTLSQGSGSYTVLPPISKPDTGKGPELTCGQCEKTAFHIHRSSSDGYLVQMEKQKQMRARVTYKAYGLKDYKQLKADIQLQGLGPDYTAIEKTKMKRQKLYSNVIREQNKNISRIPFPLTKDPEGNDKKVPRMKALEYARTIAKPPVQSQPKPRQRHLSEGFIEHAPYLEGLDASQLATLELLRKRHEEEKQAVALFRKVHAV